jgi:putative heme degradation protein
MPVLFHIKQSHAPADCPYGKGGSTSLFDASVEGVEVVGYWLAFPAHTTYLVIETDDIARIHAFLKPGTDRTVCEITPVSDKPAS